MEETGKNKSDCGCTDDSCCTPPKKSNWQKLALVLIVLAAISIAVWKLYFNNCCENKNSACCSKDSTEMVQSDTMSCCKKATKSCCPSSGVQQEDTTSCAKKVSHSCCPQ